jgi:hypothetical protein
MNRYASREPQGRQAIHKLFTSFHSKRYRPSGMLIHRQIRMHLAASGVSVAVKRRAVNRSKELKKSMYLLYGPFY